MILQSPEESSVMQDNDDVNSTSPPPPKEATQGRSVEVTMVAINCKQKFWMSYPKSESSACLSPASPTALMCLMKAGTKIDE